MEQVPYYTIVPGEVAHYESSEHIWDRFLASCNIEVRVRVRVMVDPILDTLVYIANRTNNWCSVTVTHFFFLFMSHTITYLPKKLV